MTDHPERRCELAIKIGADDPQYILTLLRDILYNFDRSLGPHNMISGGYGGNYIVVYHDNPAMSHEAYFEEVDAWIAKHQGERAGGFVDDNSTD